MEATILPTPDVLYPTTNSPPPTTHLTLNVCKLLELALLPHVVGVNTNIIQHQFHLISRVLRAALMLAMYQKKGTNNNNNGSNAKARQISKYAHLALLHYFSHSSNKHNTKHNSTKQAF